MIAMDVVFLLRRTLAASLALSIVLWTTAALLATPETASRVLSAELSSSSSACRQHLVDCARPIAAPFSFVLRSLPRPNPDLSYFLPEEAAVIGDALHALRRSLSEWLEERTRTLNLLVLLAVLRCCGLVDGFLALAVFAAAALTDALSMRKIAALGFMPPLPGINFWLARAGSVCLGISAGVGVMPFSAAPLVMFWALAAALCCAAGWVRTFHRFR